MTDAYEAVIGLEVHTELATETKMFCSCANRFGAPPNTLVCPVCMGLPGTLPIPNKQAAELTVKAGIATGCTVSDIARFDRKNYFYPDLPKAYQISQHEYPICRNGGIDVIAEGKIKHIRINRIHLEEDAGKLIHDKNVGTLIDYNRCGVPLIEIVSEPDIRTAEEAKAYLTELRTILMYSDISDCKMNEGALRCDVNISVRKKGSSALGVRTEIKNINSFSFVAKAISYEFSRQVKVLEANGKILPETRRFDSKTGTTQTMRIKESADDYRFFPEPDIPPFKISREQVARLADTIPRLPAERRKLYTEKYGIGVSEAAVIASERKIADYFESSAERTRYPKLAANILLTELLSQNSTDSFNVSLSAEDLAELATLYGDGEINSSTVKKLLKMLTNTEMSPKELVQKYELAQINDTTFIENAVKTALAENPKLVSDYKHGKLSAKKAIIGKIMSASNGRVNPALTDSILSELLKQ